MSDPFPHGSGDPAVSASTVRGWAGEEERMACVIRAPLSGAGGASITGVESVI